MSFIDMAYREAEHAGERGEIPIGCVVVNDDGVILAKEGNRVEEYKDPTAHAEILALRRACEKMGSPRLPGCDLYTTLEPCALCAGAISLARIRRLYFSAYDPKGGAVEHGPKLYRQSTCHHRPEVIGGLNEERSRLLLRTFFQEHR